LVSDLVLVWFQINDVNHQLTLVLVLFFKKLCAPPQILDPVLGPILKKTRIPVQFSSSYKNQTQFQFQTQFQKSDAVPVWFLVPGTGIGGSNMGKLGMRPTIVQTTNQQNWKCLKVFIKHAELIVNNNTR
jgi:hypothetical protein